MTSRSPADTIAAYFAAIRRLDRAGWLACFAEHAVSHDPVGAPPHVGIDGLRRYFDGFMAQVSSVSLIEEDVYVCGQRAAVKWIGRGFGKAAEGLGKPFVFEGIDLFEFDAHGRIVKVEGYWEPSRLMAQLA